MRILFSLLLAAGSVYGQWRPYGNFTQCADEFKKPPEMRDRDNLIDCFRLGNNREAFALIAGQKAAYLRFWHALEEARLDKQVGATPSSDGSTSLVSKGVVPKALAFAAENGAISRSQNGTVYTFRGNMLGIARLVQGSDAFAYCSITEDQCPQATRTLEGISASVSFDPMRTEAPVPPGLQAPTTLTFAGSSRQIAGWSVRFDYGVRRDAASKAFQKEWDDIMSDEGKIKDLREAGVASSMSNFSTFNAFITTIDATSPYVIWEQHLINRLRSREVQDEAEARAVVNQEVDNLLRIARREIDGMDQKALEVAEKWGAYLGTRDRLLAAAVHRITNSFEYTQTRPLAQPSQSSVRYIFSGRLSRDESAQMTFNAGVEWYDSELPMSFRGGRLRDGQAALQLDKALGQMGTHLSAAISAGYYWQYMKEDALLKIAAGKLAPGTSISLPGEASVLLKTKGSIHVGQAKITFSLKDTGIKFPLALTFSNRTDLIPTARGADVRGNFGILFDLDSMLTKTK